MPLSPNPGSLAAVARAAKLDLGPAAWLDCFARAAGNARPATPGR
jgi:hypothetical protein